jgi:hypothetical protein
MNEWGGEEAMFSSVWSGLDQRDGELEPLPSKFARGRGL